jgi:hypothetical protein
LTAPQPINSCCLAREIAGRFERQRAAALSRMMERIIRTKSHDAALKLARQAVAADWTLVIASMHDEKAGTLTGGDR